MLGDLFKLTVPEIIELLSMLRLDVFFALYLFGLAIPHVTALQFIQDKFCINETNETVITCLHLQHPDAQVNDDTRDRIYTFSTDFKNYQHYITTPPGIIMSLFMGYWIDSYPSHLKYLLALPCFGGALSVLVAIYNSIYFDLSVYNLLWTSLIHGLSGGFFIVMTGSYTYITRRTKAKYRAARFAILELFIFASIPIATAVGGRILTMEPWIKGQYRNYLGVFLVSFVCKLVAMVWVLMFLNDAHETIKDEPDEPSPETSDFPSKLGDEKMVEIELESSVKDSKMTIDINGNNIETKQERTRSTGLIPVVKDIFNPSTVTNMIRVCCKPRENNGRKILWHLMAAMNIMLIGHMGEGTIGLPFAQKVYLWDAAYYSYVTSVMMVIPTLSHSFLPIILIHKFHLSDTTLAIVGSVSLISALTVRGGLLDPSAFYISTFVGICAGLLPIAIRSILSRITDKNEVGQVFALLACIESSGPMIASFVYSTLFKITIQDFPGFVHHFAAFTMFYPFGVVLWLDLTKYKWDPTVIKALEEKKKKKIIAKKQSVKVNANPDGNELFIISSKIGQESEPNGITK